MALSPAVTPTANATTCSLAVVNVVFGSYNSIANVTDDSAGSITVTCDSSVPFTVALSPGTGTTLSRTMLSGRWTLYYNLYTDALRTLVWGDGTSGTQLVSGTGTSGFYTVYGRIPGGQNVGAGTYSDSITVTLSY